MKWINKWIERRHLRKLIAEIEGWLVERDDRIAQARQRGDHEEAAFLEKSNQELRDELMKKLRRLRSLSNNKP